MTFRGTRSGAKYRNFAIALALFASMLVVFAFTFIASTTRLYADMKTANVSTWKELKDEITKANTNKNDTYEITLTKDLVALNSIDITGKVKLKGDKTIYRHDGGTDFSVFKVKDGGDLELGDNVKMSGYVAKVKSDDPDFDDGSSSGGGPDAFTVLWYYGYENKFDVASTNTSLTSVKVGTNDVSLTGKTIKQLYRSTKLSHDAPAAPNNNYEFEGWRLANKQVENYDSIAGQAVVPGTYSNDQLSQKNVHVPSNVNGTLVLVAQWKIKGRVNATESTNIETNHADLPDGKGGTGRLQSQEMAYKKADGSWAAIVLGGSNVHNWAHGSDTCNPSVKYINSNGQFTDYVGSHASLVWKDPFYINIKGGTKFLGMWEGGLLHEATINSQAARDAWGNQWKINENGLIVNKGYPEFFLWVDENGKMQVKKTEQAYGPGFTEDKFVDTDDYDGSFDHPTWTKSTTAPTVDGTEIDTTVNYSKEANTAQYYDKVEYVRNDKNLDPLTDEEADEEDPAQAHQEVFNSGKGFFVQVEEGGSLNISGAVLKNFNTLTITEANKENIAKSVPEDVAPVYVKGGKTEGKTTGFTMSKGSIEENKVGYVAIESNSKDKTVQEIKKYLDDTPFTNTAGGVIFTGKNTVGAIKGTARIRLNKADAGGIIVTDEATVTLGQDGISGTGNAGGINKNVGFHHSGAALVEDGGKMFLRDSGEMGYNVTWARGGAVWATEWGTNGYVKANWNGWPTTFPIVTNPEIRQKDGGHFIMIGGEVHNNTAFIRSGAIEVESNGVELYGGVIEKNNCRSLGGAIYVEGDAADYSYTLFVKEGYIGNNVAVQKVNKTQKSVTVDSDKNYTVNYVLDRYLNDGALKYCEEHGNGTEGTTFDRDFNGAMGNGGGVWLCPVGGTSVFADGGKDVIIDENTATGTGTDFYLSRGNGAVMVQDLKGDWYKQNGQNTVGDKLNFDNANGTVLNGPLAMKNMRDPAMQHSGGVKIQSNQSRDGGGIACNGTLMLGGPKDVFRYDARVNLTKKWETTTDPEEVTFDLYYKENGERKGGVIKSLKLNGKKDAQSDGTGVEGVNNVGGQDIEGEWTEDSNGDWTGGLVLPQYVEINGEKKALYVFKFEDPDNSSQKVTYDPVQDNLAIRDKLYRAVQKVPATEEQLADGRVKIVRKLTLEVQSNFELVERGGKYKVDFGNLEASATATSEMIELMNPAAGTSTTKFYVTFTTAEFAATATNKDKELEIPAHKNWLDEYGMVYATKKPNGVTWAENNLQNDNGYMRFINWPESGVDRYALTLEGGKAGGPARKYTISLEDIKPLVTGNASDMTNASDSKVFNQGTKIEDRYIEWKDNRGKAKLSLEKTKYYIIYDVNGNLVYAEPAETVDPQCNNGNGGSKEYNWPADYMVAKAKALLIQRGKTQAEANALIKRGTGGGATTNNPADGFCQYGERVYLYTPKLVYTVAAKDETGADYTYTLSEEDINSYTEKIAGNQEDGFKVANRYSKTEISATKKWIDRDGEIIMTQSFGSHEFKVDGSSVWVNWPSANTEYVRIKLEDKAAGSNWSREDQLDANAIKDYLANPNNSWDAGRGSATIKFDKETYCVVLEKTTNKVVMTIPKSEIQTVEGQTVAQVAISRAAVKSGKQESELKMEERLVYFPKVVYNIDKFSSENVLAKYVITELGVGSGSYGNGSNMRTDDYVPTYYDAAGRIINYNSSIEDADKHLEIMKAGITICNERKVNVKLTKKWKDNLVSSTTLPTGVTAKFQLMKYDENQKKFVDVAGQEKTLTSGSTLEWTGLAPGRYAVRESSVPNGYITDMPTDGTAEVTIKQNNIGQDVFEFTATNTKLTDVEATKHWGSVDSNTWPDGKTAKFHLKRWLKYDSFGNEIHVKKLSTNLYIMVDGSKKYLKKNTNNEYYVEVGGKTFNVQHKGFVEIDGMLYAILPKDTDNLVDNKNVALKVLITPKDKDGNDVTQTKTATSEYKTVTWTSMPKYDYGMKVSDEVAENDSENKKVRIVRYWIEEEWVSGYDDSISYNGDTVTNINVLNKTTEKIDVPVRKYWNDGGLTSSRPTIKFQLWARSAAYDYYGNYNWEDNGKPMSGAEEFIITPDSQETEYIWKNLTLYDSGTGEYHYYAPREMVKVGQDDNGKDVFVYVTTFEMQNNVNQKPGKIVATPVSGGYQVEVFALNDSGQVTTTKIGNTVKVKTLDENALGYNAHSIYFKSKENANGCGLAFGLYAYNTKPAIEKYVKKDVHKNLETKDEVFTYDIMAFVPAGSKEIKIYDPLVKALEFVDKSGKKQSESSEFSPSNLVDVAYMNTNNHKAVSKDPINASVVSSGTALPTNKYTVAITRNPSNGSPLGSSSAADYDTKLNNYINLTDYKNELTVTIPESTLTNNVPETGLWVKVTFKAKIRDDINFENLDATQREKLGFETITTNDPVETEISTHTGFKNKASYDVKLVNNYKFENVPSNEVTVVPPTSLKLEKRVTGTLGDLNKEFVFKVELDGVKHTDGDNNNKRDYYYAKDKSNVVNGVGQPKAYMHEDMNDQNHQTYRNGFNVSGTTKNLWFKLKAGQSIEIQGLPVGAKYKITEVASDHRPSYKITDLGNVKEASREITTQDVINRQLVKDGNDWIKATAAMVGTTRVVATNVRESSNSGSGQALSTAVETVDPGEIAVVTYTNHRDIETETGIIKDTWPWNIILLIVLVLLAYDDQMRKIKNRLRIHRISQV